MNFIILQSVVATMILQRILEPDLLSKKINKIRRELNKQGFNYGRRLNYKAIAKPQGAITPFHSSALKSLREGKALSKNASYIITQY